MGKKGRHQHAKEYRHKNGGPHSYAGVKTTNLRKIFCQIASHPGLFEGRPFIRTNGSNPVDPDKCVEVYDVIDRLEKGHSREHIRRIFHGVNNDEADYHIGMCRAYQARFLADTIKEVFERRDNRIYFMLDENISQMALYDTVRLFGRSSHVYAEGLGHKDDEKDIWAYMKKNGYQAILTRDDDFIAISENHRCAMIRKYGSVENCPEPVPAVIYCNADKKYSTAQLLAALRNNAAEIRQYLNDNDAVYAEISINAFRKHRTHDEIAQTPPLNFPDKWKKGPKKG